MAKDSSFRLCIAALLVVQIACWALTLLDLYQPGQPRVLLRTALDVVAQMFSRKNGLMLTYQEVVAVF